MIRALAMIAGAGFLVSVVTISAAVGIAGPEAVMNGGWSWSPGGWGHGASHHHFSWRSDDDAGPQTSRDIPWSGGETLDIDVAADVRYTQAAGPGKITISGPRDAVQNIEVKDGRIGYAGDDNEDDAKLTVTISAPAVNTFTMRASGSLAIENYSQDKLSLALKGDADATARGETKDLKLNISGSADANLEALKVQSTKVEIDGSGNATLAPTDAAEIELSGSGDATLLTNPPKLQTNLSGSGRVIRKDGQVVAASKT